MNLGSESIFIIIGVVLIVLILILLQKVIHLEGTVLTFTKGKASDAQPAPRAVASAPVQQVGEGVPGEVVAAIMAAIYTMSEGKYTLKAVRRGYNGWAQAGISDATAPF